MENNAPKVIVFIIFIIFMLSPYPGAWVNEKGAIEALEKMGYTEVKITERDNYFVGFRGGSAGDEARFVCTAKNSAGQQVNDIYVYGGWPFKNYTVRF
jgi:hypothetical protein